MNSQLLTVVINKWDGKFYGSKDEPYHFNALHYFNGLSFGKSTKDGGNALYASESRLREDIIKAFPNATIVDSPSWQ